MILRFVAILDWLDCWLAHLASISLDNFSRPGTGLWYFGDSLVDYRCNVGELVYCFLLSVIDVPFISVPFIENAPF